LLKNIGELPMDYMALHLTCTTMRTSNPIVRESENRALRGYLVLKEKWQVDTQKCITERFRICTCHQK
jgi:hypothetical protein